MMSNGIAAPEKVVQKRIIDLLRDNLGFDDLGNWQHRKNNSNIEEELLTTYLKSKYDDELITRAIEKLRRTAQTNGELYDANKAVYALLHYGVTVKIPGQKNQPIQLINWKEPHKNHFAVAEEVTLRGAQHERRPDVVLYVNGIALAVLELKKSSVSMEDGIRQNISNQRKEFNQWFFSTVQFLLAGNDSQGLHYGPIGTQDKHFLRWKEEGKTPPKNSSVLDWDLSCLCEKARFLDLIYNFILFDGGIKKLPRPHQYFAVKAAQERLQNFEGGIIWHTQGSGKSLIMVLLAQWILEQEHIAESRVLIITDRRELEDQINAVFASTDRKLERTENGFDLLDKLQKPEFSLLSALVHKFGNRTDDDFTQHLEKLEKNPPLINGKVFVLVDECHRTESGRLHRTMRQILQNHVFVGFTGTPLLRADRETSTEMFGGYIHTYQYDKAIADEIVLDLIYEARDIEQTLASSDTVDKWFEAKTSGLSETQKQMLQERWANMRKVLSSRNRIKQIVLDVLMDFNTKPRLKSERGTAMLVVGGIREACMFYREFAKTELHKKCAIVTSYELQARDLGADTGAESETDEQMKYKVYQEMLTDLGASTIEECEKNAKKMFIEEPSRMRLLIVVDKLLTGFDAPSCTYLYLDKKMQDHGLFQAICRTNRPDGADKTHGFIVDYKDLFRPMQDAVAVYTSELDSDKDGRDDANITIQNRLKKCREKLEEARENMSFVLQNVPLPKTDKEYIAYFCGATENEKEERKDQRDGLYKASSSLLRAYANIADDMGAARYSKKEVVKIKQETTEAQDARKVVRLASGEYIDTKPYEADMRHLIDNYIEAGESRIIADFSDLPLVELINMNIVDLIKRTNVGKETATVIIANNVRAVIKKARMQNPEFYDKMSEQLEKILEQLRNGAIDYEEYLRKIRAIVQNTKSGTDNNSMPEGITTPGQRALYDHFNGEVEEGESATLTLSLCEKIQDVKPAGWQTEGNQAKKNKIRQVIDEVIKGKLDSSHIEPLFVILIKNGEFGDNNN